LRIQAIWKRLTREIDFEMRSVEFYEEQLPKATDSLEQEFIKKMIVEERGHHAALTDMKFYLSDPAGWFREKERGGPFDGGFNLPTFSSHTSLTGLTGFSQWPKNR